MRRNDYDQDDYDPDEVRRLPRHARAPSSTQREGIMARVRALQVVPPPPVSREVLIAEAMDHHNTHRLRPGAWPLSWRSPKDLLERVALNYLRHVCVMLEEDWWDGVGNDILRQEAYVYLVRKVCAAVKSVHPWLADACAIKVRRSEAYLKALRKRMTRN